MKMKTLLLSICIIGLETSQAAPLRPSAIEETSRALQQAKRVASSEKDKSPPSRAVWLGRRVARHSKLAFEESSVKPTSPKKKSTISN